MATDNYNSYEQVYNVREDSDLLAQVAQTIVVLMQRGVMIAGYSVSRELLTIHYRGYNRNKPVWELDFFENLFGNEAILAAKDKVKAVFILSDKQLVVPEALYERESAETWLKKIHFIEPGDKAEHYRLPDQKAHYIMAFPVNIVELIRINFKKASVQPLSIYQFRHSRQQKALVQCCITAGQACVTLLRNGELLWHKVFDYAQGSDIAYELKHFCRENNIDEGDMEVRCDATSAVEHRVINEIAQYFTAIVAGSGNFIRGQWDAAISLAKQLQTCV